LRVTNLKPGHDAEIVNPASVVGTGLNNETCLAVVVSGLDLLALSPLVSYRDLGVGHDVPRDIDDFHN
jgi:hypothetical protein